VFLSDNCEAMKALIHILILFPMVTFGQNLIINPDFETHSGCPNTSGQYLLAEEWFSPNLGSPDYFNDCSNTLEYGTEFNCKGGQIPHSGHGYMGILSENLHNNEYFEYLETHLNDPLVAGQTYCIRFYVSLGDCDFALQELGAVFSQTILKVPEAKKVVLPYVPITNGSVLSETEKWMCIKGTYKAKGGERYLTIGYFNKEDNFIRVRENPKVNPTFRSAYYFIDDVSVMPVGDEGYCITTP
jgi:OmpA-OmpF porin, OOP family